MNFLQIAESKDIKSFQSLLPKMVNVITAALAADDETVLEDALVEFNELAEIEPGFFKAEIKSIFEHMKPVIGSKDFANNTIRHQPMEFVVTIVERKPSVVKKDSEFLKDILDNLFRLMIDIDEDIEESWMRPKEGYVPDADDEEEDNVHFGKDCVDRLVSSVGEEIMLPLIGTLVTNTIQNDSDWRFKHAGIMAFSQVGEYVDDPEKIAVMVPVLVEHLAHPNPKVRFAALHCIGQLAEDMAETFQKRYAGNVLEPLVAVLEDSVPRVQSHAAAALTNFLEGAQEDSVAPLMQPISAKLCNLISNGISLVKEAASTALAALVELMKEAFIPYF